jgi:hypothetical protein
VRAAHPEKMSAAGIAARTNVFSVTFMVLACSQAAWVIGGGSSRDKRNAELNVAVPPRF